MVHARTDDNHRFAMSFMRVFSELAGDLDDALTAQTSDDFLPSGRARYACIVIIVSDVLTANAIVDPKVGNG